MDGEHALDSHVEAASTTLGTGADPLESQVGAKDKAAVVSDRSQEERVETDKGCGAGPQELVVGPPTDPLMGAACIAMQDGTPACMDNDHVHLPAAVSGLELGTLVVHNSVEETVGMTAQEAVAYTKLKGFCSNIIEKLAPPLLKEVQAAKLRPDATPFTPKRTTRAAKKSAPISRGKENPAENVLLHTLGMVPEDLVVDDGVVQELQALFDSPLREQHVRIIVGLFGKAVPAVS